MALPSAGSLLGTSKTQDFVLLGVLALAGYIVWQVVQGVKATAGLAGAAGSAIVKGAQTVTAPVAAALASAWNAMTATSSMPVLGNVLFPDGTLTPIAQLTVKQDSLGNVYVASPANGLLFQLQPSNADGNWPALQITDPSQIGQAPLQGAPPGSAGSAAAADLNFGVTAGDW